MFVNPQKIHNHNQYQELRFAEETAGQAFPNLKPAKSLPIWEEIVHRDLETHRNIVAAAPGKPWTLYKLAKAELVTTDKSLLQIGGYPQWLINNADFRNVKPLQFICSYIQEYPSVALYYFLDEKRNEIELFRQKF